MSSHEIGRPNGRPIHSEPIVLRTLRASDRDALIRAIEAWPSTESAAFAPSFDVARDFAGYVELLEAQARGERLPAGWVPSITLFGFLDDTIVGRLQFRRSLNERLLQIGGNIGYVVLPEFRNRGYAKSMLRQSLDLARRDGLTRVLVTCDEEHIVSARVIESAGGVLQDIVPVGGNAPRKRRYWISL